jgi:hypothetical protein
MKIYTEIKGSGFIFQHKQNENCLLLRQLDRVQETMSGINSKVEVLVQARPINFSKLFSLVQTLLCKDYLLLPFANLVSAEL